MSSTQDFIKALSKSHICIFIFCVCHLDASHCLVFILILQFLPFFPISANVSIPCLLNLISQVSKTTGHQNSSVFTELKHEFDPKSALQNYT